MNFAEFLLAIGVVVSGSFAVITLTRAFAKRITGAAAAPAELEAIKDELAQLRADMDDMRAKVGDMDELHNRVEFTERVIGQMKNQAVLPGGGH